MKNVDQEDLKVLFLHTKKAYGNISFESWKLKNKEAYEKYARNTTYPKTFAQWVNGQILALTTF